MGLNDLFAAALAFFQRAPAPVVPPASPSPPMPAAAAQQIAVPVPAWLALCRPLTEHFEGCRLTAYPDPASGADPWTCGWGCTGPDIVKGTTWTQDQADSRLTLKLNQCADEVDRLVKVTLTPAQKAALVDFEYNEGEGALSKSTLLRLLNLGDFATAANEFGRWDIADGRVLIDLEHRRAAERQLFTTGKWSVTP